MSNSDRLLQHLNLAAKEMEKRIPAILEERRRWWLNMVTLKPGDTFPRNMGDTINITKKP